MRVQDTHSPMACVSRVPSADGLVGPRRNTGSCSSRTSYRPYPSPSTSSSRSPTPSLHRPRDPLSVPPPYVDSHRGALRVFAYSPPQGPRGATITANIDFTLQVSDTVYLRLVLGRRALTTSVRRLPNRHFELQARVPLDDPQPAATPVMSLSAQALSSNEELIDTVTFGSFSITDLASYAPSVTGYTAKEDTLDTTIPPIVRSSARREHHESPAMDIYPSDHYMQDFGSARGGANRPSKKTSLIRTRRTVSGDDDSGAKCASLVLETGLESMTENWDKAETAAGRRLVRFARERDGSTLKVTCEIVKHEDFVEGDAVVSCIYRKDTDSYFVTSVDIILLLERLVGQEFDIEEKNRIRRNLEGFRPKTVSKNRPESSEFFLQIMNFAAPKPRNIEKDLKVFDWSVLPHALEKIISRYTLPLPQSKSRVHSPERSVPSSVPSASTSPMPMPLAPMSRTQSPAAHSPGSSSSLATPEFSSDAYGSPVAAPGSFPYLPSHERSAPSLLPAADGGGSSSGGGGGGGGSSSGGGGGGGSYEDAGFYDSYSYSSGSTASTPMVATPSCHDPQATFGVDVPEKAFLRYPSYHATDVLGSAHPSRGDFVSLNNAALPSFDSANFDSMSQPRQSPNVSADPYL